MLYFICLSSATGSLWIMLRRLCHSSFLFVSSFLTFIPLCCVHCGELLGGWHCRMLESHQNFFSLIVRCVRLCPSYFGDAIDNALLPSLQCRQLDFNAARLSSPRAPEPWKAPPTCPLIIASIYGYPGAASTFHLWSSFSSS
jgi:hypothetical protein